MSNEKTQAVLDGIEASIAQLAEETDAYRQSEEWARILRTMSLFHNYSVPNQIAIAWQRPDATRVAGYETWKKLGRHVIKGAKGIAILAPIMVTSKQNDDTETEIEEKRPVLRFRTVHVFDYADTEGKPIEAFNMPSVTEDNGMLPLVLAAVKSLGIEVSFKAIPNPAMQGYSEGGRIVVKESLPAGDTTSVLIHEAAHELLHWGAQKEIADTLGKQIREVEAESTAYAVLQHLGIESTANLYLSSYGADGKLIKAALGRIHKAVTKLIDAIEEAWKQTEAAGNDLALPLAA